MVKALSATFAIAAGLMMLTSPVIAQKSQDNLRYAISNSFSAVSMYFDPVPESNLFARRVYESVLNYDEHNSKFVPGLAKAWTRIDPITLEFELRDDVVFHNGNKFDADDVVATVNLYAGEKTVLRYKSRYDWIDRAEKMGPYKVRIIAKTPTAIDIGLIAYQLRIEDAETHKTLANWEDYGRKTPVGTGAYKVTMVDATKGTVVERYDAYKGDKNYMRAPTRKFHGIPITERQTQIAQLLTGAIDVVPDVSQDQAKDLKVRPGIELTTVNSGYFTYFNLASHGKVNKAIADPKVREAIHMAIDRDSIMKYIVSGGEVAERLDAPCFKSTIGCKFTKSPPAYDPERAKKLLAEAGYPNGFDLNYVVQAPIKDIAIAIAGQLSKVGIRVTVSPDLLQVYRKKQSDGVLEAWSVFFSLGNHPDVSNALNTWFSGERADYFNRDPIILDAMEMGLSETDPQKRDAIYQVALDRNAEMHYVLPLFSLPTIYAHSKDAKILNDPLSESELYIGDYGWK